MNGNDGSAAGRAGDQVGVAACRTLDLTTICTPCHQGRGKQVQMIPVHAHYQCPSCGWRDSCCM